MVWTAVCPMPGSILGPILFILYTKSPQTIAKKYGILFQLSADDSQLYIGFYGPLSVGDVRIELKIEDCLREIKTLTPLKFEIGCCYYKKGQTLIEFFA